ncbi:hypothetical protein CERSUDRAFT_150619, partial [Gelatoporia subvermispora B]
MEPPASTVDMHATAGAALIGLEVTLLVYSINLGQLVVYLRHTRQDGVAFKTLIVILWLLDSVHLAFIVMGFWQYAITGHGRIHGLLRPTWPFIAQVYIVTVSNLIVHNLFAHRIWKLSGGRKLWPVVIVSRFRYKKVP